MRNNGTGFDTATVTTSLGTIAAPLTVTAPAGIVIVNTGAGVTATNNGNGLMTINSTATAAVTVNNTGNGAVNVTASGSNPITLTHTGDDDFTYPVIVAGLGLGSALGGSNASNTSISGTICTIVASSSSAMFMIHLLYFSKLYRIACHFFWTRIAVRKHTQNENYLHPESYALIRLNDGIT
ncbi:hypothetical protein [Gallionella capsiferriformans]|uniref:Uncharacterized protein n=1 Tax=Gallionella capsiferriformans (strain ES-2) TaxID=395494 RepID=D9SFT3_GALCS|nr:hypothetical protein [Gallionella capsiferriformans]ADL55380.1 hypothetical protein Galf_1354 [Gallionella capsiferriformans ES-2]